MNPRDLAVHDMLNKDLLRWTGGNYNFSVVSSNFIVLKV